MDEEVRVLVKAEILGDGGEESKGAMRVLIKRRFQTQMMVMLNEEKT
jgi:hypothetical protein